MRKATTTVLTITILVLLLGGWFLPHTAFSSPVPPEGPFITESVRAPVNYEAPSLSTTEAPAAVHLSSGLRAIAIVGEVEGWMTFLTGDMDGAVSALESHGVSVTKFYYDETSFTWSDIVSAAQGAHFLLYMGHGVSGWGGSNNWGGFYLGDNQFVSPSTIRRDLDGVLAPDSIIIFSHACYTAGSSGSDSSVVSQGTAETRVHSYAEPFIDIGMEAYFANNYSDSAAGTVNSILADSTMESTFKEGIAYSANGFVDLTYPETGYDLWLDKCLYGDNWNLSFVGIPEYVFSTAACYWADVDCSGTVDVIDVQAVAGSWRCADGDSCYQTDYDVDEDGVVTVVDITMVAAECN